MKYCYELIVNGNEQKVLGKLPTWHVCMQVIKCWLQDGRLKRTDKVVIRTIITTEEKIEFDL